MLRRCVEMPRTLSIPKRPPLLPVASGRADGDGADRPLQCTPVLHRRADFRRPRCGPPRAGPRSGISSVTAGWWVRSTMTARLSFVSFFDWAKNETQKSPRVLPRCARVAPTGTSSLCSRRGTTWKGPEGHPGDSRSEIAQTTHRSDRVLPSPPDAPDCARPGYGSFRRTPAWTKATCQPHEDTLIQTYTSPVLTAAAH
jgi:hypothetical protein